MSCFTASILGASAEDASAVKAFQVKHPETGKGLELYLKEQAFQDEHWGVMRTYLVRLKATGECVRIFPSRQVWFL